MKNVHIAMFENQTSEPGIREVVTNRIIAEFIEDNTFRITERKIADAMLTGSIARIEDGPYAFEGSGGQYTTTDYKITLTVTIRFENLIEKKILWEETISGWGRYSLSGEKKRIDGMEDAIRMIVQNILNKVIADW